MRMEIEMGMEMVVKKKKKVGVKGVKEKKRRSKSNLLVRSSGAIMSCPQNVHKCGGLSSRTVPLADKK